MTSDELILVTVADQTDWSRKPSLTHDIAPQCVEQGRDLAFEFVDSASVHNIAAKAIPLVHYSLTESKLPGVQSRTLFPNL